MIWLKYQWHVEDLGQVLLKPSLHQRAFAVILIASAIQTLRETNAELEISFLLSPVRSDWSVENVDMSNAAASATSCGLNLNNRERRMANF